MRWKWPSLAAFPEDLPWRALVGVHALLTCIPIWRLVTHTSRCPWVRKAGLLEFCIAHLPGYHCRQMAMDSINQFLIRHCLKLPYLYVRKHIPKRGWSELPSELASAVCPGDGLKAGPPTRIFQVIRKNTILFAVTVASSLYNPSAMMLTADSGESWNIMTPGPTSNGTQTTRADHPSK